MKNNNYGFSLIELAIVLFIISLMLSTFLSPLSTSLEQRDREKTAELLEEVRESLIGYALVNGHFPCPDCPTAGITANCGSAALTVGDGIEDGVVAGVGTSPRAANFTNCATSEGNLPWTTLDVAGNDAWGNRFVYRVVDEFADDIDGTGIALVPPTCVNPAVNVSFCLNSANDVGLTINDENGVAVAAGVPAIVVSIGNNSDVLLANLSATEAENQDLDTTFISSDYNSQTGTEFDDLLTWISPQLLMYQMVRAERLP